MLVAYAISHSIVWYRYSIVLLPNKTTNSSKTWPLQKTLPYTIGRVFGLAAASASIILYLINISATGMLGK